MRIPLSLAASLLLAASVGAAPGLDEGEWRYHDGDPGSRKYSSLTQISKDNVRDLKVAWRWTSPDEALRKANPELRPPFLSEATPLMVDEVLYMVTSYHLAAAIDAEEGMTLWSYDPETWKTKASLPNWGFNHRGLAYGSVNEKRRVYLGTGDGYLISLDVETGRPDPEFGMEGKVDLTHGLSRALARPINDASSGIPSFGVGSPPVLCAGVLVVGSNISDGGFQLDGPPGDVRGYDPATGKQLWRFDTIPPPGELGNETWEGKSWRRYGNTNVWTLMSCDPELGYVYLPVGEPTNDLYGGGRGGDNLFSDSLVCLDARTGKRVWHFQLTHHGLWDYDPPAAPVLGDIEVEGTSVPAVIQVTKQGMTFVFDRITGRPVWPIEERPAPAAGAVEGEKLARTQPFPTRPEPFERQGVVPENLIDFTPELRKEALAILEQYQHGPLYTPPSLRGTLVLPGRIGGANWSGAAFDPETGILYVPSLSKVDLYRLARPERDSDFELVRADWSWAPSPRGLPLVKPPYGRLTAIGLNDGGKHLWMVPVGDGPRDHEALRGLALPPLGSPRFRFPLVTRSGLLFLSEGRSPGRERAWREYGSESSRTELEQTFLRAFDKMTGALLWEYELPGPASAQPMTYLYRGKQYLLVTVGGMGVWKEELVAFALP